MSESAMAVLDAAKRLTGDERFEVLEELESYCRDEGEYEYECSPEFEAELERRYQESERDPTQIVKWSEAKARLLAMLSHE